MAALLLNVSELSNKIIQLYKTIQSKLVDGWMKKIVIKYC